MRRLTGLAVLAIVAATLGSSSPAGAQQQTTGSDPALAKLERCVEQRGRLLTMVLVDESASLKETDPQADRVTAALLALEGLSRIGSGGKTAVKSEIEIAGFANDFTTVAPWTELTQDSLGSFQSSVQRFANQNDGLDTDYAHALAGAQRQFAARSAELTAHGGQPPCKFLLWFTDGQYSIDSSDQKEYAPDASGPNRSQVIIDAGRHVICDARGVADQLHGDDVIVAAVPLSSGAQPIPPQDLSFLRAVTNGSSDGVSCGTSGSPTTGTTIPANDLSELLATFDQLGQVGASKLPGTDSQPVCQQAACPEGTRSFEIDASMPRFHLLAQPGVRDISVQLTAPGLDAPVQVPTSGSGTSKAGSTSLEYSWITPTVLTLDGSPTDPATNWAGTWTVTFIDTIGAHPGAVARSRIYLYGGLAPKLAANTILRRGKRNVLTVQVEREKGVPVSAPSLVKSVGLRAVATDPTNGQSEPLTDVQPVAGETGTFHVVYQVPTDYSAATAHLDLDLDVVTSSGFALNPTARSYDVEVRAPIQYPQVKPSRLHLPSVNGTDAASGRITATANGQDGCFWIDQPASGFPLHPSASGKIKLSVDGGGSESDCVKVPAHKSRTVTVQLQPSGNAAGSVKGALVAGLAASRFRSNGSLRHPQELRIQSAPSTSFRSPSALLSVQ